MMDVVRKNVYVCYVVISSSLAFTCLGSSVSWASPSLVKLRLPDSPIPVSNSESSWIGSFIAIGACAVAIPYIIIFSKIGRKWIIVLTASLYLSGWIVLNLATTVTHICVARFLMGCAVGPTYGAIPTYLAEVVSKNVRGSNMAILLIAQSVGAFSQFIMGPILSMQVHNGISLIIPLIFLICALFLPESPYYLAGKEDHKNCIATLMLLRGETSSNSQIIIDELNDIEKCLQVNVSLTFWELIKKIIHWNNIKVFIIIALLTFCQQFSGSGPIIVYLEWIFKDMGSTIEPKYAVMLTEALSDITIFVAMLFINKIGRKKVMTGASAICICANIMLGFSFYFKTAEASSFLSSLGMIGVFLFQMGMGMGLGSIPFLVMSEVMSYDLKSWMSGFYQISQGIFNATAIKLFQIVADSFGNHYAYWMFAISLLIGVCLLLIIVPETRGKSLAEIQDVLKNNNKTKKIYKEVSTTAV